MDGLEDCCCDSLVETACNSAGGPRTAVYEQDGWFVWSNCTFYRRLKTTVVRTVFEDEVDDEMAVATNTWGTPTNVQSGGIIITPNTFGHPAMSGINMDCPFNTSSVQISGNFFGGIKSCLADNPVRMVAQYTRTRELSLPFGRDDMMLMLDLLIANDPDFAGAYALPIVYYSRV